MKKDLSWYNDQITDINKSVDWIESKISLIEEEIQKIYDEIDVLNIKEGSEEFEEFASRISRLSNDYQYMLTQLRHEKSLVDSLIRQFVSTHG